MRAADEALLKTLAGAGSTLPSAIAQQVRIPPPSPQHHRLLTKETTQEQVTKAIPCVPHWMSPIPEDLGCWPMLETYLTTWKAASAWCSLRMLGVAFYFELIFILSLIVFACGHCTACAIPSMVATALSAVAC